VTPDGVLFEPRGFLVDRRVEAAKADMLGKLRVADGVADVKPA
jgi:hypothetical protein